MYILLFKFKILIYRYKIEKNYNNYNQIIYFGGVFEKLYCSRVFRVYFEIFLEYVLR